MARASLLTDLPVAFHPTAYGPLASTAVYECAGEGVVWLACGALGLLGFLLGAGADGRTRRRLALSRGTPRPA